MFLPRLGSASYRWLPLAAGGCLLVGFVVPYIIAVRLGHVYPVLPYISDTGALHPENCVFGQMLNMAGVLLGVMIYIRYKQVAGNGPTELLELNKMSAFVGYLSAFFLSLVANVQINEESRQAVETEVHLCSAFTCFGSGYLYCWTQTWITYKLANNFWSWAMTLLRLALSLAGAFFMVTFLEFRELANAEFNGTYADTMHWNPYDGGYMYHVYSAASEYSLGIVLLIFTLSLYKEFSSIQSPDRKVDLTEERPHVEGHVVSAGDPLVSLICFSRINSVVERFVVNTHTISFAGAVRLLGQGLGSSHPIKGYSFLQMLTSRSLTGSRSNADRMLSGHGFGWVPLGAGALLLVGIVVPYIIAVRLHHVYPFLPYISDTGALQPESCVFGQMLNAASVLIGALIYLRYWQVANRRKDVPADVLRWNSASRTPGYLAVFGLSVVANFQVGLEPNLQVQTSIHVVGSVLCFGLGVIYGYLQSRISYALSTDFWSWAMAVLRFFLTALCAIFFITFSVYITLAFQQFNGTFADHMHWGPDDGGYVDHIISAVAEYLMALTFTLFLITYYDELKTIKRVRELWCPRRLIPSAAPTSV
ncbi:uncharacterized protein LOC110974972 [Acanthaster planci]|uniref:Uncharacterized protein LOC110974972 n=1 Tax=Acanthaster planci TaxID=133434 RepID=A0A8B7XR44_ACAPL|nr:uncharacterized protein LOC110974972 [Acanthaster planci]